MNKRIIIYVIAFGRAIGKMRGQVLDVHGAGSQRSDPKIGSPTFRGPQGDAIRVNNYATCVRGGTVKLKAENTSENKSKYPYNYTPPKSQPTMGASDMRDHQPDLRRQRGNAKHFVKRLDKDGDGKVSKEEFDGPKHHFQHFDKDKYGFLSESEAPPFPPPHHNHHNREKRRK